MASNYNPDSKAYQEALKIGRPPNIVKLFPESRALIVSGKYIDKAMLAKGGAIAMAANGRSNLVIRGALLAAQQANACLIIEIARSEGGAIIDFYVRQAGGHEGQRILSMARVVVPLVLAMVVVPALAVPALAQVPVRLKRDVRASH